MKNIRHGILSFIWIPAFLLFLAPQMQAQSVYRRGGTAAQQQEREKRSVPQKKEEIGKNNGRQPDRGHKVLPAGKPQEGRPAVRPGEKPGDKKYDGGRYRPEGRYDNGQYHPDRRKGEDKYRPGNRPASPGHRPGEHRPSHSGINSYPGPGSAHQPGYRRPVPPSRPPHAHRPVTRPNIYHYGHRVPAPPRGALIIHRGPYNYYYAAGRYYRPYGNAFVICRPPAGAVIAANVLSSAVRLTGVVMRDAYGVRRKYYTDGDGVYYVRSGRNYIVVEPPVGAVVYELPYGWQEAVINGITYYRVDDHYYELVFNPDGSYYYRVAGKLIR